jgi:hypothetical protein
MWVGWTYDNVTSTALQAELNSIGQALSPTPTDGTSTDQMFQTTAAGSFFNVANPAGAQFAFTGTPPPIANTAFALAVAGQDITSDVTLADTALAYGRNISWTAKAGTFVIDSGSVLVDSPNEPLLVVLPAVFPTGAVGPDVTIELDGSSFLKKTVTVTTTGTAQTIASILLQNGDVDNSGEVDAADIDTVIAAFGATFTSDVTGSEADVDASGEVDAADIDIVIANFGGVDG